MKENSCFREVDYIVQLEDKRILSFVLFCFVSFWDEEWQTKDSTDNYMAC